MTCIRNGSFNVFLCYYSFLNRLSLSLQLLSITTKREKNNTYSKYYVCWIGHFASFVFSCSKEREIEKSSFIEFTSLFTLLCESFVWGGFKDVYSMDSLTKMKSHFNMSKVHVASERWNWNWIDLKLICNHT